VGGEGRGDKGCVDERRATCRLIGTLFSRPLDPDLTQERREHRLRPERAQAKNRIWVY
jgi:hypothetical protein